jgi:RNA polymerase sigma factor (sigma-70 family)
VEASTLDELLRQVRPHLDRTLFRYRIPAQDAEDILQETLLLLVMKWDTIHTPVAWFRATFRNRCIVYWRRQRRSLVDLVDTTLLELVADSATSAAALHQLEVDLESVLERLPPRCRALLRLRYGLGFSAAEVGQKLGYSPTSVPKLTQRCLSRLTRQLAGLGIEVGAGRGRRS